jgi:hypothetical protein
MRVRHMYSYIDYLKRWKMLNATFKMFKHFHGERTGHRHNLQLDLVMLHQAVISYFYDMERYKTWHQDAATKKADDTKQFAFSIYWLMKTRPVYIATSTEDIVKAYSADPASFDKDQSVLANAQFAIFVGSHYQDCAMNGDLAAEFLYGLTFREFSRDSLMMMGTILKAAGAPKPGSVDVIPLKPYWPG